MTNFAVQSIAGPVVGSLVSKDNGSVGNRVNCAGSQIKNNVVTMAQMGVVTGAAAGGIYAVGKNQNVANTLAKGFDAGINTLGKLIKKPDLLKKVDTGILGKFAKNAVKDNANFGADKLKGFLNNMKKGKAGVLIAAIALPVLSYISSKHTYKMGQIDQQYTDKAKMEKTLA